MSKLAAARDEARRLFLVDGLNVTEVGARMAPPRSAEGVRLLLTAAGVDVPADGAPPRPAVEPAPALAPDPRPAPAVLTDTTGRVEITDPTEVERFTIKPSVAAVAEIERLQGAAAAPFAVSRASPYDTAHPKPAPVACPPRPKAESPAKRVYLPALEPARPRNPVTPKKLRFCRWFLAADWRVAEVAHLFDVEPADLSEALGVAS